MAMDLVFLTQLARTATREPVTPVRVTCPVSLEPADAYIDYFGVTPDIGPELGITFSTADANRRFLTARESLWSSFEPALRRQSEELDGNRSMADSTRSVLFECLPGGEATIAQTARRLGVSHRTLQRRLQNEGVTFRDVVRDTRNRLARHYLTKTGLPYREISFLLGFDEPSSFFRAFRTWTGETPESFRAGYAGVTGVSSAGTMADLSCDGRYLGVAAKRCASYKIMRRRTHPGEHR